MSSTPVAALPALLARLREAHRAGPPTLRERLARLGELRARLASGLEELCAVIAADFGRRSRHETLLADGMTVLDEIDHALARLPRWTRPRRVSPGWKLWPARARLMPQPLGVVGILSPWNYPVNLSLIPVVAAWAAGNHVLLKPSERAPRTAAWLGALLARVFPPERVSVVEGDAELARAFVRLPFDHLFFTGATAIGREVMRAAAENLVPVTLELGGKSPALIAPGYPLAHAAERIAAGKCFNAGQTCIAPDYALLPEDAVEPFAEAFAAVIARRYPQGAASPDYTAIIDERHYRRLSDWLDEARSAGARVWQAFAPDAAGRIFPPTLVFDPPPGIRLSCEEIFGPILPLLPYRDLDQAIAHVLAGERPLALYAFDRDRRRLGELLARTHAGGVTVNDTMLHVASPRLPFGGIGASGMGSYHGEAGFRAFSHFKPVLAPARLHPARWLVPPYRGLAARLIRLLVR
ncbi:MAG: coniferyl aldehyde dehydrogenase [Xanthomonadales bacterium]|nr:coniferyl aldehyde dehydrogenase [Xanthomonadales bacterium]